MSKLTFLTICQRPLNNAVFIHPHHITQPCILLSLTHCCLHYNDVIISAMASQITSLTNVYSMVYSGADQRKHQSFASLASVRGIHLWPVNSPHKRPVTRKMFPFDDDIMEPKLTYCPLDPQVKVMIKLLSKYKHFLSWHVFEDVSAKCQSFYPGLLHVPLPVDKQILLSPGQSGNFPSH